jgi:hypothetical protein
MCHEWKLRNAYKILVDKSEEESSLGGPRHTCEDNINLDLKTRFIRLRIWSTAWGGGHFEHDNERHKMWGIFLIS